MTQPAGYRLSARVPGYFVRRTAYRVVVKLLLRDGSTIERRILPSRLSPRDPNDSYPTETEARQKGPTMPTYLGKAVSDEYLKSLIDAYRDGQREQGGDSAVEDSDQPVLDALAANEVLSPRAPSAFELGKRSV